MDSVRERTYRYPYTNELICPLVKRHLIANNALNVNNGHSIVIIQNCQSTQAMTTKHHILKILQCYHGNINKDDI